MKWLKSADVSWSSSLKEKRMQCYMKTWIFQTRGTCLFHCARWTCASELSSVQHFVRCDDWAHVGLGDELHVSALQHSVSQCVVLCSAPGWYRDVSALCLWTPATASLCRQQHDMLHWLARGASVLLPTATARVAAFCFTTNMHMWCARTLSLHQRSIFSAEQSKSFHWKAWIDGYLQTTDRWVVSFRYTGER